MKFRDFMIYVFFYLIGFVVVMMVSGGGVLYSLLEMIKDPVNLILSIIWFVLVTIVARRVVKWRNADTSE